MLLIPSQDIDSFYGTGWDTDKVEKELTTIGAKNFSTWDVNRRGIALTQYIFNRRLSLPIPLTIDGLAGPSTLYALELYHNWSRDNATPSSKTSPRKTIFPLQRDCPDFYGKAGEPPCSARTPTLPYSFRMDGTLSPTGKAHIAGDFAKAGPSSITRFALHEKLHDSILSILSQVLAHYGLTSIRELGLDQYAGAYNYRPMRGGTSLSMHAYGAAIDFDAQRNSLHETRATARFATSPYRPFIDAFYDHGWISLGRERDFDWMHFQAARLS